MKTNIILVNYNNWRDTIICIEDLLRKKWKEYSIIIVDNASTDESVYEIENYLNGDKEKFIFNNFPKWQENEFVSTNKRKYSNIHLIKSEVNNGFAYGNNLGIKLALEQSAKPFYIWLLNNDTVVKEDSLLQLIRFFESDKYGLVGSKLLDFEEPHNVQALYGSFNKYLGIANVQTSFISNKEISYPIGASLFLSSEIIDDVGLLDESYFLYYEELDYSTKVKKKGYEIGVADKSIVYHKQGATTKSKKTKRKQIFSLNHLSIQV